MTEGKRKKKKTDLLAGVVLALDLNLQGSADIIRIPVRQGVPGGGHLLSLSQHPQESLGASTKQTNKQTKRNSSISNRGEPKKSQRDQLRKKKFSI